MGKRKVLITATYELEKYVWVDAELTGDDLHEHLGDQIPQRLNNCGDDVWLHDWKWQVIDEEAQT